jgi:catechol 2,3-dioxygenase-like lactoylglutathione lyase family enzyme
VARIQHIAIASKDAFKQAAFYQKVFGFKEVRRLDNPRARGVVLTDGAINISVLEFMQDQLGHGMDFTGPHHIGVFVDDLEGTAQRALAEGCERYSELPEDKNEVNYRSKRSDKFRGPENCVFDIADEPWAGTSK